jgi:phospholipase/lecithinase/hemolysin
MLKHWKRFLWACVFAVGLGGPAHAGYTNMVVFGDSLSDTGNVLSLTSAFTPQPFPNLPSAPGRFSDGAVWTEYLAAGLGLPSGAQNSNLLFNGSTVSLIGTPGGQNYAYGGARTGLGGAAGATTGMMGQLAAWNGAAFASALARAADPDALYVVFGGANDLRDARSAYSGASPTDDAMRAAAAAATAQNITNIVGLLSQAGARHFLVSNLPDLGKTPEAAVLDVVAASTDITLEFNASLAADIAALDALLLAGTGVDLDIRMMDFYSLNEAITNDALNNGGALYGITNVTAPCITPVAAGAYYFPGSVANSCASATYSDLLHPSAAAHRLIGQLALSTVPEPASLALVALGFAAAFFGMRRRAPASARCC